MHPLCRRVGHFGVAAGFTRIIDFARHVKQLRVTRAELRRQHLDPIRRSILDALDRVLLDRRDLLTEACSEARCWGAQINAWWGRGKPRAYDGVRIAYQTYYPNAT